MHGGRTDALSGLSSLEAGRDQVKNSIAPVEPMVPSKAPMHQMYYVLESMFCWTSTHLQHRLNRRFRIKAPVHQTSYVPESLFELISEPLQHRLNRCPYGACTGAMTQAWILCQNSNGYFFDTERPVEPMPIFSIPSVLPVVTVFLQKTSNGYVTSSTLYKGTPWFISVAF